MSETPRKRSFWQWLCGRRTIIVCYEVREKKGGHVFEEGLVNVVVSCIYTFDTQTLINDLIDEPVLLSVIEGGVLLKGEIETVNVIKTSFVVV